MSNSYYLQTKVNHASNGIRHYLANFVLLEVLCATGGCICAEQRKTCLLCKTARFDSLSWFSSVFSKNFSFRPLVYQSFLTENVQLWTRTQLKEMQCTRESCSKFVQKQPNVFHSSEVIFKKYTRRSVLVRFCRELNQMTEFSSQHFCLWHLLILWKLN